MACRNMPEICYPCPRSDLLPMSPVRTPFSLDRFWSGRRHECATSCRSPSGLDRVGGERVRRAKHAAIVAPSDRPLRGTSAAEKRGVTIGHDATAASTSAPIDLTTACHPASARHTGGAAWRGDRRDGGSAPRRHLRTAGPAARVRRAGRLEHGFLSCAHWLHWRTGIDLGAAREKVRVAKAPSALPRLSGAMQRGKSPTPKSARSPASPPRTLSRGSWTSRTTGRRRTWNGW